MVLVFRGWGVGWGYRNGVVGRGLGVFPVFSLLLTLYGGCGLYKLSFSFRFSILVFNIVILLHLLLCIKKGKINERMNEQTNERTLKQSISCQGVISYMTWIYQHLTGTYYLFVIDHLNLCRTMTLQRYQNPHNSTSHSVKEFSFPNIN